jgi:23S rRNA (uracil1939-C5)-methyltransferase
MSSESNHLPRVGDELEVTVESVAFGGDGVARHEGYVLFVPDVIPGERVVIRLTAAKRSYGRGVPIRVAMPSADRTEPRCKVYGVCGGCQYQHVEYERSLVLKEQQIKEVVLRIGGLSVDDVCEPIHPAPEPYGYRSSISLRARKQGKAWEVGYSARDNESFVSVSNCPIASSMINASIPCIGSVLDDLPHRDRIKDIILKCSGEEVVAYPTYHGRFRAVSEERLSYHIGSLVFRYGPTTFFQINHALIRPLANLVAEGLDPHRDESLFDLYAGVGLFSIALAGRYRRVFGIETGREAVAFFQDNIRENNLSNVTAVRGVVEKSLGRIRHEIGSEKASVLVDPPREGMKDNVVRFLNEAPVRRLVYVSCDPSTLARDLKKLGAAYALLKITPLDMFPQTKHIEAVAVMEQRGT